LAELGHRVVGLDLSEPMIRSARDRLGPCVALADADRVPLADASVDTVVFVWVLQLVDDVATSLRRAAGAVRSGGRVITVLAGADDDPDDEIAAILRGLRPVNLRSRSAASVIAGAPDTLNVVHHGFTPWTTFDGTPQQQIDLIEQRGYSSLFDVDDDQWTSIVVPVLEQLRGLPDPRRPRQRRNRHPLLVWSKQ
jgi:SAM-dependent methyltransferase